MRTMPNKQTSLDNKVLKQYIETLDNIQVKYISRSEYIFLGSKIIDNGYLYLPEDITQNDYLDILSQVNQFYNLSPTHFGAVQDKTRILTAILLKVKNEEISSLSGVQFSVVKKLLKEIKKITQKSLKSFDQKDIEYISNKLSSYLNLEFFKGLYEVGNKNLKDNLKVFTKEDKNKVEKRKAKNISGDYIRFKGTHEYYDFDQTLRKYIGFDDMMIALQGLKIEGNEEKIAAYELEVIQEIFKMINIFPYHLNKDANGYNPKEIVKTKEIYCVGFALIVHGLLEELGISHEGIDILQHVAIKINIGGKPYLFDNVMCDKVELLNTHRTGGTYDFIENIHDYGMIGDISEVLIAKILHNNGAKSAEICDFNQAIASLEASIKIFPTFDSFLNISKVYKKNGDYQNAIKVIDIIMKKFGFLPPDMKDILYDDLADIYYEMGDYKNALKNFRLVDSSLKQGFHTRVGDTYFHLGEYAKSLGKYNEELRVNTNDLTLRKTRLKIYVLKKILNIKTLFDIRYKKEKKLIDERWGDENILEFVNAI